MQMLKAVITYALMHNFLWLKLVLTITTTTETMAKPGESNIRSGGYP